MNKFMYIYDTRNEFNCKTLPLNGWFFPCIVCGQITCNKIKNNKNINIFKIKNFDIPFCINCKKNNSKLPLLNKFNIKNQLLE